MTRADGEVERAREILGDLIDLSGMSRREVERRLAEEDSGTDVTRVLSGKLDLKLRHILDICRMIGIYPLVFFNMLLKEPEPSPLMQKLETVLDSGRLAARSAGARTAPLAAPWEDMDALRRRVGELIGQLQQFMDEASDAGAR
jgi:hypothetical protein